MSVHQSFRSVQRLVLSLAVILASLIVVVNGDIVFDNEIIKPEEIFDLERAIDSTVTASTSNNATKYYCVFRSLWTKKNHPQDFPIFARYGTPIIFSHTKQYIPFLKNREAPQGVEKLAEDGFTDKFEEEMTVNGNVIGGKGLGKAFEIDQEDWDKNFVYLPAVNVSYEYNYISGLAPITPSPDWFTGFYLMDTVKVKGQTFYDRFILQSYPWDAGTDNGLTYTATAEDTDPPGNVVRFTVENAPNKIFVNEAGDEVLPVAEWECILHTCPPEDPGCEKADWPPSNGCDILRYPECNNPCDIATDSPCSKCKDGSYFPDCCLAGADGEDCIEDANESEGSSAPQKTTTGSFQFLVSSCWTVLVAILVYMG